MTTEPYENPDPQEVYYPVTPQPRSFWGKMGGGSLSISLLFHLLLLIIGVVWVLQVIPATPEKKVDFMPKSGGGGSPATDVKAQKQRAQLMQPQMVRVSAMDAISDVVLPDPESSSAMTSLGALSSGGLSAGLGGSGAGGGKGDGIGKGIGGGMAPGLSNGNGTKNPFGFLGTGSDALVGTFYDLKQTRGAKPTDLNVPDVVDIINKFTTRGWRESALSKYYVAKQTLAQTKIYIPMMPAEGAPAAFDCSDAVLPSRWVVVYRGIVSPPRTGKYRFVGAGDDVLVVRFNGKNVFDHGYFSGTTPVKISDHVAVMKGQSDDPNIKKELRRDFPMEQPMKAYEYPTTRNYNGSLGGLAIGPEFEARAGNTYPIEILISELPGGLFGGVLLIEEQGVTYEKAATGAPILPLFRLDGSVPEPTSADNAPPFDPNGPVWKVLPGRGTKPEI